MPAWRWCERAELLDQSKNALTAPGARELDSQRTGTQLEAPVRALVEDAEQRIPKLVEQTEKEHRGRTVRTTARR